ncbi:flagellar biosynthetic protein FliO [Treponema sp.]|uniref:FliO/MopB family protein n=1 Tax=Treponema sp. TaxID=166 RepID=UPI0025E199CD|nr:flagellar biosynthetic protein FliO [Treponema sp.]MCR5217244.1 flagellar biosynthetic protein FliO [Treponema sp.]
MSSVENSQTEDPALNASDPLLDQSASDTGIGVWAFIKMILVLAFVVAALYLFFRFIKKRTSPNLSSDDPFLRNVASVSLGIGKSVQIVTLIDKAYMVGVSENGVSLIDKIEDKELINAMNLYNDKNTRQSKPRTFGEILDIFMPPKKSSASSESAFDGSTEELLDQLKNKRLNTEEES